MAIDLTRALAVALLVVGGVTAYAGVLPSIARAETPVCDEGDVFVAVTPSPPPTPNKYQQFMETKQRLSPSADTVIIGDSLAQAWPQSLAVQKFGPAVVNLGQGGDRTQEVLWRLKHLDLGVMHPKRVIILVGTNNLGEWEKPCAITAGIKAIVDIVEISWGNPRTALIQLPPRGKDFLYREDDRIKLNHLLVDLAARNGLETINLDGPLMCIGNQESAYYLPDHIHFTRAGYELISQLLAPWADQ
jgi:lysophospholipase L1-like esterase